MRYLHTMVRVSDLEVSLHFYTTILGLKEVRRVENEDGRFTLVFLAAPKDMSGAKTSKAPVLELTYNWPPKDGTASEEYSGGRNFGHLAYEVENIYEFCDHLMEQGVTINRPPRDGRMAFIKSPDGISIELLQAGDSLAPAEPWLSMKNEGVW